MTGPRSHRLARAPVGSGAPRLPLAGRHRTRPQVRRRRRARGNDGRCLRRSSSCKAIACPSKAWPRSNGSTASCARTARQAASSRSRPSSSAGTWHRSTSNCEAMPRVVGCTPVAAGRAARLRPRATLPYGTGIARRARACRSTCASAPRSWARCSRWCAACPASTSCSTISASRALAPMLTQWRDDLSALAEQPNVVLQALRVGYRNRRQAVECRPRSSLSHPRDRRLRHGPLPVRQRLAGAHHCGQLPAVVGRGAGCAARTYRSRGCAGHVR